MATVQVLPKKMKHNHRLSLTLKLPLGFEEKLQISPYMTILLTKSIIERLHGIPVELQTLLYNGIMLTNTQTFMSINNNNISIFVSIAPTWSNLMKIILNGDREEVLNAFVMLGENIDRNYFIFVTLYISAAKSMSKNIATILSEHRNFDLHSATKVTGRTVLHSVISAGCLRCVLEIKQFAGLEFEKLLYVKDKAGSTPRSLLNGVNAQFLHYINKFLLDPITLEEQRKTGSNHFEHGETFSVKNESMSEKQNNTTNHHLTPVLVNLSTSRSSEENQFTLDCYLKVDGKMNSRRLSRPKTTNGNLTKSSNFLNVQTRVITDTAPSQAQSSVDTFKTSATEKINENTLKDIDFKKVREKHRETIQRKPTVSYLKEEVLLTRRPSSLGILNDKKTKDDALKEKIVPRKMFLVNHSVLTRQRISDVNPFKQTANETEKVRIEKPWNNWIKAITTDTKSNKVTKTTGDSWSPPEESIQKNTSQRSRRKTFEQWVLGKKEMEVLKQEKLETQYEQCKANRNKNNKKYRKTFEEWHQEVEESEKKDREIKKLQDASEKKERDTRLQSRRKESTTKYEEWLLVKEKKYIEQELKAITSFQRRKSISCSISSLVDNTFNRQRSTTM